MKYCIRRDFRNKWRWYLESANGKRLATGESYKTKQECVEALALVRQSGSAPVEDSDEPESSAAFSPYLLDPPAKLAAPVARPVWRLPESRGRVAGTG